LARRAAKWAHAADKCANKSGNWLVDASNRTNQPFEWQVHSAICHLRCSTGAGQQGGYGAPGQQTGWARSESLNRR
jgi:hypothetical protein